MLVVDCGRREAKVIRQCSKVQGEERLCFFVRNVTLKRPLSTKGRGGTTLN